MAVKWLAKKIRLTTRGFLENRLVSHSLHTGGAIALKLSRQDMIIIKKYGY